MNRIRLFSLFALLALLVACGGSSTDNGGGNTTPGQTPEGAGDRVDAAWRGKAEASLARGAAFLEAACKDGKWAFATEGPGANPDPGISALAAWALLEARGQEALPVVRPTLEWLVSLQKTEGVDAGAIYADRLATYVTSAAVMALAESGDTKYQPVLDKAAQFLKRVQSDESDGLDESSEDYGGVGYGGSGVTNMSTTQFAVEAADRAGLAKDDAFYSKALRFLQRSQNRSESNDAKPFVKDGVTIKPGNDGGAIYRPTESKAGTVVGANNTGSLRSYGSMTYALLKSYILCGVDATDPRIKAAVAWMGQNFELDSNPGMEHADGENSGQMGLFYYYMALGRALDLAERNGTALPAELGNWRGALAQALMARQDEEGAWNNPVDRWNEGSKPLASAYAVIALASLLDQDS